MSDAARTIPFAFRVMAKPVGPACNLRCAYCFYLEKARLFPDHERQPMSEAVLDAYIRQSIEGQQAPEIHFAWQGGEPTLAGLPFFQKAVELQRRYAGVKSIHNAIQTNGILINDDWAAFFAEHQFLVGLSLDGPEPLHNAYRRDAAGEPTFDRVMRGIECLKRRQATFNILACVNRRTAAAASDVYRFLRAHSQGFIQFIPIVEREATAPDADGLRLVKPDAGPDARVTPWSVEPLQYGRFLAEVFDLWVQRDVGAVYVQIFDTTLEAWCGMEPSLCYFRSTCGNAMILEHNGDLYACDHFVYPEHRLGNLLDRPLREMAVSPEQRAFGAAKRANLPSCCHDCPCLFACRGECPKRRFLAAPNGEPGLNYLCEGYRFFFRHIDPYMRFMANELRQQRPPANVMAWARARSQAGRGPAPKAEPNAPCPCGTGHKFKKCCGRVQAG